MRNRISKEKAKKICELLDEGKLKEYQIAEQEDVSKYVVSSIYRGLTFVSVSKDYTFGRVNNRLTYDDVVEVCKKLQKKERVKHIAIDMGVSTNTISLIKCRKTHTDVSKNYKF